VLLFYATELDDVWTTKCTARQQGYEERNLFLRTTRKLLKTFCVGTMNFMVHKYL